MKCCACGAVCVISRAIAGCVAGGALHRDQKIKQNKNGMGVQWVAEQSREESDTGAPKGGRSGQRGYCVDFTSTHDVHGRCRVCRAATPPVPAPRYSLAPIR